MKTNGKSHRRVEEKRGGVVGKVEDLRRLFVLFTIGLSLLIGGFWINSRYPHPSAYALNGFRSAAFRPLGQPDPLAEPRKEEAQLVENEQLEFMLPKPVGVTSASMSFVFYCEPECGPLWLDARTERETWLSLLVWHPAIGTLPWFFTQESGLSLFQKELPVKSLAEIATEEKSGLVAADPGLIGSQSIFSTSTASISADLNPERYNYLVTTFLPHSKMGKWHRFGNQIRLDGLQVDSAGNLLLRFRKEGDYKLWIARPEANFW